MNVSLSCNMMCDLELKEHVMLLVDLVQGMLHNKYCRSTLFLNWPW